MKVYKYYIKGKNIGSYLATPRMKPDEYIFYAYTADKDLASLFESSRDMTKFKRVVSKGYSKKDYTTLKQKNPTGEITDYQLITLIRENDKYREANVYVVMNNLERITLDTMIESDLASQLKYICPFIFKNEYIEALKTLQYVNLYKLFLSSYESDQYFYLMCEMINKFSPDDDVANISNDELELFLTIIEPMLKNDKETQSS